MFKLRSQPCPAAPRRPLARLAGLLIATAMTHMPQSVPAQENKGPRLLRDTEIEQLLRDYTRPILRAAGMEKQNIQVVIITTATSTPSSRTVAASSSITAR